MTVPRWLIPALAVIAAVAVAVAGVLIGIRFAPPVVAQAPSDTVTVPVLAPVDDVDPDDPGVGDPSPVTAETKITLPGSAPVDVSPGLGDVIDALTEAPDPGFTLLEYDPAEDATDDDPCAPRDGAPPADCPAGLSSTVLSLVAERDFGYGGQAFPPTLEEFRANGNRFGGSLWCDGLVASDTDVPFGILSTAPASLTLEYWPTERPGETTRHPHISSPDDQRAEYLAALMTAESSADLPMQRTCLTLEGLEPDTAYTAVITGVDDGGRIGPARTIRFHSAGAPVHPGAQIVTIGENLVFVSALHPEGQSVDIRVHLGDPAAMPECSALPAGGGGELSLTDVDMRVDEDEVNAVNAPPDFRFKRVRTFAIPEGSAALVCARWYTAGTAPSWMREQPLHESSALLQSPDRLAPVLTLTSARTTDDAVTRIGFHVASVEGSSCGTFYSWRRASAELPVELCRGSYGLRTGGATVDGERLWDVGFRGDLALTWSEYRGDAEGEPQRSVLPAADAGCRGVCAVPAPRTYRVASENSALTLVMSWEQGAQNGLADWSVTAVSDVSPAYVRPDEPQFDLDERWQFTEPTFPPGYGYVAPLDWVYGRFELTVDRPVNYVVRLTHGVRGSAASGCSTDGTLEVSGRVERTTVVSIPYVCLGGEYYGEIELVDDAGTRVVWDIHDRPHFWAAGAGVYVPTLPATVHYDIWAQTFEYSYISVLELDVDRQRVGPVDERSGRCTRDGIVESHGTATLDLHVTVLVRFSIRLNDTDRWDDGDCRQAYDDVPTTVVEVEVPVAELYAPEGASIELPDAYRTRIVLRATRT